MEIMTHHASVQPCLCLPARGPNLVGTPAHGTPGQLTCRNGNREVLAVASGPQCAHTGCSVCAVACGRGAGSQGRKPQPELMRHHNSARHQLFCGCLWCGCDDGSAGVSIFLLRLRTYFFSVRGRLRAPSRTSGHDDPRARDPENPLHVEQCLSLSAHNLRHGTLAPGM